MMFRRRRPLMRAAMVGGVAYHVGKKTQQGRDEDAAQDAQTEQLQAQQAPQAPAPAPAAGGGISDDVVHELQQLAQLKDQGILTQEEFDQQKQKLLQGS